MVGATGFEPATPCPPGKCATMLRYAPTSVLRLAIQILECKGKTTNLPNLVCVNKNRRYDGHEKTRSESPGFVSILAKFA